MVYHPQIFTVSAPEIVRGLFDSQSLESSLLEKAACGKIRLVAKPEEWNKILWLLVNSFKNSEGKSLIKNENSDFDHLGYDKLILALRWPKCRVLL